MEQNKQETGVHVALSAGGELALNGVQPVNEMPVHPVMAIKERVSNLSVINTLRQLPSKGAEIARAAKTDVKESEHKFHALASLAGVIAVEAVGATRAPTLLSLPAAVKVQKETGLPVVAGVAAGTLYGAWSYAAARAINSGINHLPRTFEVANTHLPSTEKLSSVLPGLKPSAEQKARIRGCRGLAAYCTGISLYILAAGLQNQSQTERRKLCANLGRDGGAFMGALALGVTGVVLALQQKEPELGERILDSAGNSGLLLKVLIGGTVSKIGIGWAAKKVKKQWSSRQHALKPVTATR